MENNIIINIFLDKISSQSVLFYEPCGRKGFIKRIFEYFDDSADG